MSKTLALLLAAAFLYLAPSALLPNKGQTSAAPTKFHRVANPIPNRYIVVLATTDLSPIAAPAPTPVAKGAKTATAAAISSESVETMTASKTLLSSAGAIV